MKVAMWNPGLEPEQKKETSGKSARYEFRI